MHAAGDDDAVREVEGAVRAAGERHRRLVLAVSGGLDSMVMLDAVAAVLPARIAAVATFDHGTGAAATRAAAAVVEAARTRGLRVLAGRAEGPGRGEAAWRADRWRFLRSAATEARGSVATAHTADDQAETVFMRALRGAGARGLAGLRAESDVVRPLLGLRRATMVAYAAARRIAYVEDPSNRSRGHLRNRVRLDLLPALEASQPGFHAWLLDLGERAAEWRRAMDALAPAFGPVIDELGGLSVAADELEGYDAAMLAIVWPVLAARAGVTLDGRGTRRLAEFTISGAVGGAVQLSGGFEVLRRRGEFVLRRAARVGRDGDEPRPLRSGVGFGSWRFREAGAGGAGLL